MTNHQFYLDNVATVQTGPLIYFCPEPQLVMIGDCPLSLFDILNPWIIQVQSVYYF